MEILIFIIGMCCGSFVNMLVFRTEIGYGLTSSRGRRPWRSRWDCFVTLAMTDRKSVCDFCGRQLGWYENIPVVSWVIQKGRSRCCGNPLPWQYPVVEIGVGVLFLLLWKNSSSESIIGDCRATLAMTMGMVVMTMLVFGAVFDAKYMILPDFSTVILIIAAGVMMAIEGQALGLPLQKILSAGIGAGFLGFLYLITKGKGMGLGDVKLAVFMGLWLGWPKILVAFYIAFIVGAVVGVILMARKKLKGKSIIAFGPFLILGTIIASFWGDKIILMLDFFQP